MFWSDRAWKNRGARFVFKLLGPCGKRGKVGFVWLRGDRSYQGAGFTQPRATQGAVHGASESSSLEVVQPRGQSPCTQDKQQRNTNKTRSIAGMESVDDLRDSCRPCEVQVLARRVYISRQPCSGMRWTTVPLSLAF